MLTPLSALACEDWVAKVVALEGAVQHKHGQQDWQPLQREQHICPGGSVKVGDNSRASLHLRNNTFARLDADSLLSFPVQTQEHRFWIELRKGLAHFISRIVHEFEVSTPYVNAVVEGTEFVVAAQQRQGAVSVMEGKVTAYNEKSRASLTAGEQAISGGRDQDLSRFNVPANTLVEWAIHYPPVLSLAELPAHSAQEKAALERAIVALQQNRIDQALQVLSDAPSSDSIRLAQATLLLQIGRLPEFNRTIEPLLQAPLSGLAHGLKAIAAIARNDIAAGRASANIALQRAPDSAAAWIVLSYAQQAELQLNAALDSARKATQVQPSSLLAHLRLSELYLAQGNIDAARDALEAVPKEVARGAELEGSKGFVQLFRLKLDSAREHFNRALAMNSSNPQYQLGLGLTLLRDGDLKAGRQHMEYAVSLDPLRSVLRSYLGRAYFEEKRDDVALEQWQLAKQFDPNDPTPYFYTGVHKLFANDPIGAVEELETSRDLNDKRAIYRSETLLQSDAASRSATLARAYGEVGYDQGVLLSGWDALRRDPTNSEGHRLLADYYAGDPRYETARVSELLQSQLWQPLSAYPLQPQLSEANLAVVAGAGPQRPGFNEYHSLFTQDGAYGMVNGYGGSDGTWGNDLVGSILAGPVALSLGQYHYESDGWRENADQEQDIFNGLVQWQVGAGTSVQYESRKVDWDKGDLAPRYSDLIPNINGTMINRKTDRLGVYHELGGSSSMVLSAVRQTEGGKISRDLTSENSQKISRDDWSVELQMVSRFAQGRLIYGLGYWEIENDLRDRQVEQLFDPDDDTIYYVLDYSLDRLQKPDQSNGYFYYFSEFSDRMAVDVGLSYDKLIQKVNGENNDYFSMYSIDGTVIFSDPINVGSRSVDERYDQWSPKLGMIYKIDDELSIRVAAFRVLKRYLISGLNVEPTLIAGFVQNHEDPLGSDSRNYGIALDYGVARQLAAGVSYLRRDISSPFYLDDGSGFDEVEYVVGVGDAYCAFLWDENISLKVALSHASRKVRGRYNANSQVSEIDNYSVPILFQKSFHSGFSLGFQQTYFDQSIKQNVFSDAEVKDGWTADAFVRYRLPNRVGNLEAGIKNIFDEGDEFVSYDGSLLAFYPSQFSYLAFNFNM